MKKIEFIWRDLLYRVLEKRQVQFEQQTLASEFHLSSSTVHLALAPLRQLGAVRVGGRGFTVVDYEKILYHWANHRTLRQDIVHQLHVDLSIVDIEGQLPDHTATTTYTAVRERYGEAPAQYDAVYCYHDQPDVVRTRFSSCLGRGAPNLIMLQKDPLFSRYGQTITLGQLFVDLWSMTDWYAKEFVRRVKEEIDGILS